MLDATKWFAALALVAAAVAGFYAFADYSLLLRVSALLLAGGLALVILAQTEKGSLAWGVVREARAEVRKVVWPTRKETVQTTAVVIAMVSLVAVILWGLDGVLGFVVRRLLEHGG
jgi:preprotein translocase subunit SecE